MSSVRLLAAIKSTTPSLLRERASWDAIIVGAGAAGSMAAMLLTQLGLRVLVLDAGWRRPLHRSLFRRGASALVRYVGNPHLYAISPPAIRTLGRRALKLVGKVRQPVQSRCFAWPLAPDSFVDDRDSPYRTPPGKDFDWMRCRQLGGRMIVPGHGRQYYRLPASTLYSNSPQAWPLAAGELDPWYEQVERILQIQGGDDTSPHQPSSVLSKRVELSAAEVELRDVIRKRWPQTSPVLGQQAPPFQALAQAAETDGLNIRQGAVAKSIDVDEAGRLKGVTWFDCAEGRDVQAQAPLVFVCASALESTRILMNSRSKTFPEGIGAESGALGRHLMDHVMVSGEGAGGALPSEPVANVPGRCIYVPRFDLREEGASSTGVAFGVQLYRYTTLPGRSQFTAVSFGEMAPRAENQITLHPHRRDAFGIPLLEIDCRHDATDIAVAKEQADAIREIADVVGAGMTRLHDRPATPGAAMHECGTVRMGTSPRNSVLDPNNQVWNVPGLYVTDAGCFPSQAAQNPTLTIMAITARACAHAASGGAGRPAATQAISSLQPSELAE